MPSSKGEPDNPKLREQVKEEVKRMEKGGGSGSWSAWKAGEMARRYEAKGGGYIDKGDHKNKSQKGEPEPKDPTDKKKNAAEMKGEKKKQKEESKDDGKKIDSNEEKKDEGKKDSSGAKSKGKKK